MLCHRAVKQLFTEQLRVIDSHPYENVGCDGRPLAENNETITPDYETIFIKGQGDVDIEKVLSSRSSLPRMGVGMLGSRESPSSSSHHNGEDSELGESSTLPSTLDEFQVSKPVEPSKSAAPAIHEPPPLSSSSLPAPQRFKKGNLRLLQGEDGGWKLEELEEKRRSLESQKGLELQKNESFEKKEEGASPRSGEKPPQADMKSRKKKSREEKGDVSGPSLLRKPSMKKLKAFFDKDKNKENKSEKEERNDSDYANAVSKLPSVEADTAPSLPGSKSVPSSLDRKQRHWDGDFSGANSLETRGYPGSHNKYWPLGGRQEQERPALPVKRSKSMKSVIPPGHQEPSFGREDFRESAEPGSPSYDTYPKAKPRSEELIDLTKRLPQDPPDQFEGRTRFDFDPQHTGQGSGGEGGGRSGGGGDDGRTSYHFGEGQPKTGLGAPPKPKRDWSSLSHDYANMNLAGGISREGEREHIRNQLTNYVNVKMRKDQAGISHARQGSGDSQPQHPRQNSTDSAEKNSDFLDTQMAKLMERKGHSRDETDSGIAQRLQADPANMRRSKSGEIPRPDTLTIGRSVSGELHRNPEILDEDARKMLKDCQEYLLGAFDLAEAESRRAAQSTEGSPRGSIGRAARSLHSSPGNSYTKYGGSSSNLNRCYHLPYFPESIMKPNCRSHSGHLNLSPPGTIQKPVNSPTGTVQVRQKKKKYLQLNF